MKSSIAFAALFLVWATTSEAVIYQYTDDSGHTHYTNDLASVPVDKLEEVTETEETESTSAAPSRSYSGTTYPILQKAKRDEQIRERERETAQKKAELEAEYEALLKEKEAIDNDESFQKRRNKKKYQNRPYIKELVAREEWLIERLAELERELEKY